MRLYLSTIIHHGKHAGQTVQWMLENDFKYFERYIYYKYQSSEDVYAKISAKLDISRKQTTEDVTEIIETINKKNDFTNLLGND